MGYVTMKVLWFSIPKSVLLDTHPTSPRYWLQDRTQCVGLLYSIAVPSGETVRQCGVLVDQSSSLYDLLSSLPHFLKNSDCLQLSALGTEVNWNLALGDCFLPCFLSLKKVPHGGENRNAFFVVIIKTWAGNRSLLLCLLKMHKGQSNFSEAFEKRYLPF